MVLIRQFWLILLNVVYLAACLVPKNRRLWLFGAWNGRQYSDNSKYLFQYVLENEPCVEAYWCAQDKALFESMKEAGLPVFHAFSLKGMWLQARAGAVAYSHAAAWDFCACCLGHRTRRIQLWHGLPLKRIGLDDVRTAPGPASRALTKWLTPYRTERFDFMIACGEEDKAIYQSAFHAAAERILITGFPRNDRLAVACRDPGARPTRILYLPTFRGQPGSDFPLFAASGFDADQVDAWLGANNLSFTFKLHPVNHLSFLDQDRFANCRNIGRLEPGIDIYEKLTDYDIFITDFSSIYFDFLVTNKPILLAPIGMPSYLSQDRGGFYFDFAELAPGPAITEWDGLFDRVLQLRADPGPNEHYRRLQTRFHRYRDGMASRRIVEAMRRLLFSRP